jgi:hypothetical protein
MVWTVAIARKIPAQNLRRRHGECQDYTQEENTNAMRHAPFRIVIVDAALCWGSSIHDQIHKNMVMVMGIIGATLILRRVQRIGDLSHRHRVK